MTSVTIEGTVTPSVHLGRGKQQTVERTDFIDKLIRRGFVKVVVDPSVVSEVVDEGEKTPTNKTTVASSRARARRTPVKTTVASGDDG